MRINLGWWTVLASACGFPFNAMDNLLHQQVRRLTCQRVAPFGPTDAAQDPVAAKAGKHLLQIALGNALARGDLPGLHHAAAVMQAGQFDQGHQAGLGLGQRPLIQSALGCKPVLPGAGPHGSATSNFRWM